MNEPLKGKEGYVQSWEIVDLDKIRECNHTAKVFEAEDIKSAVEWLKKELQELLDMKAGVHYDSGIKDSIKLIDQAFEDVTLNSGKEGGKK